MAELPAWEFDYLLAGLSGDAVFRHAERGRGRIVRSAADVAAITAKARR